MNRTIPFIIVLVVGLSVAPVTVTAAVEDPRFETHVPEPTLVPGQTQQVTVQLVNDAEDVDDSVETASNVQAEMREGSTPISVKSGNKLLGTMPDGAPTTVSFTVEVPEDIDPGTYKLPIRLSYEFEGDESETTTVHARVRIEDRAYFRVTETASDVPVGDTGDVSLTLENVGTKTAHNATVTTQSKSADLLFGTSNTASEFVTSWEPGETRTVTFDARATADAQPRTYTLTTNVAYEDAGGTDKQSFPMDSGVTLLRAQEFSFADVQSTLRVGEEGTVTATVTNDGPRPVSDAVVTLNPPDASLKPSDAVYGIGDLAVGESATVRFPITVADSAEPSPRRLGFTVSYWNVNEDLQQTEETYLTASVAPERDRFQLDDVQSSLQVGEEGDVSMTVRNNGEAATDVVVEILPAGQNIHPQESQYAIGAMDAGAQTTVEFPIDVSDNAKPIPRQLSFQVTYEDQDSDQRQTPPYNVRVQIDEHADRFLVEPAKARIDIGGSATIEVEVTNNGDTRVENVNAKIFADDPLSADDDEAYIDVLEPGASETVTFSVGVAGSALPKAYPLSMDLQYEENGDTKLSDTYQVPVTATESDQQGIPTSYMIGGAIIVLVAIGAVLVYRRR